MVRDYIFISPLQTAATNGFQSTILSAETTVEGCVPISYGHLANPAKPGRCAQSIAECANLR